MNLSIERHYFPGNNTPEGFFLTMDIFSVKEKLKNNLH